MRGDSGFVHGHPTSLVADDKVRARQPGVMLPTLHILHVFQEDNEGAWCVWLNTQIAEFDGLCVGLADTREEAVAEAVAVFESAIEELRKPAPAQDGAS